MNLPTLIVCLVLLAGFVLAVRKVVRDKKAGKRSCGFSCSDCPMSGSCRRKTKAGDDPVSEND